MPISREELLNYFKVSVIISAAVPVSDFLMNGCLTLISSTLMTELCRIGHGFQDGGSRFHCDSYKQADPSFLRATNFSLLSMIVFVYLIYRASLVTLKRCLGRKASLDEKEFVFLRLPCLIVTLEIFALFFSNINESSGNNQGSSVKLNIPNTASVVIYR